MLFSLAQQWRYWAVIHADRLGGPRFRIPTGRLTIAAEERGERGFACQRRCEAGEHRTSQQYNRQQAGLM